MTTRRWILGSLIAVLTLGGHIWFHYTPRARPDVPRPDSGVAELLDAANLPAAVWVPYPHQNLVFLRETVGMDTASIRATARLAGLPSPTLPTFGPLALPPSSEIAAAADETGEHFIVVAQVYPTVAAFAKLAGKLASNPWLSGGEIVVEERPAEVSWQGNRWTVTSTALAVDTSGSSAVSEEAAPTVPGLAWIRIRQSVDPLPAGFYRLWEKNGDVGITTSAEAPPAPPAGGLASRLESLGLFLLVYAGRHPALGEPAQALAFFDQQAEQTMEMPRVAALHEPGNERWELPGESLLELAQRRPQTATAGAWAIAALDSLSLEGAGRVAPELEAVADDRLRWGLWLDFRGGLAEVERIARLLEELPFAPRRQVERWSDVRRVLLPLAAHYSDLTATVTSDPRTFDLRLKALTSD